MLLKRAQTINLNMHSLSYINIPQLAFKRNNATFHSQKYFSLNVGNILFLSLHFIDFFKDLNWSIIALQCCVSFCYITR